MRSQANTMIPVAYVCASAIILAILMAVGGESGEAIPSPQRPELPPSVDVGQKWTLDQDNPFSSDHTVIIVAIEGEWAQYKYPGTSLLWSKPIRRFREGWTLEDSQ